jgi:peptide/nickel transport system permease protein
MRKRDVLKKAIGPETPIFVGLAAAAVATFSYAFGAVAGYYGKWIDDFFNWFYSVFSSIPYLLLILAVAAVLQQKGMLTIILILGLTGWTGIFRLVRGEYLKHKAREYVQAADAIGASNAPDVRPHLPTSATSCRDFICVGHRQEILAPAASAPVDVVSWGSINEQNG